MKKIIEGIVVLGMLVFGAAVMPNDAFGVVMCMDGSTPAEGQACPEFEGTEFVGKDGKEKKDLSGTMKKGINVFLGVIGFIAVVMMIYGGFLYTTSAGDTAKVTKAKNAIMYGLIGLIVALLAFAIVNFVTNGLFGADKKTDTSSVDE